MSTDKLTPAQAIEEIRALGLRPADEEPNDYSTLDDFAAAVLEILSRVRPEAAQTPFPFCQRHLNMTLNSMKCPVCIGEGFGESRVQPEAQRGHAQNCECHEHCGQSQCIDVKHTDDYYSVPASLRHKHIHDHPYRDPRCAEPMKQTDRCPACGYPDAHRYAEPAQESVGKAYKILDGAAYRVIHGRGMYLLTPEQRATIGGVLARFGKEWR